MVSKDGIRAIFFDLDGTLRLHLPPSGEVFADYARQQGLSISGEDRLRAARWEHYYWASSPELYADQGRFDRDNRDFWCNYSLRRLIALGAKKELAEEFSPQICEYMTTSFHPEAFVPQELRQVLPSLRDQGFALGVVSNRDLPYVEELEKLDLSQYFDFSLAAGEVQSWKPDAGIFAHALKCVKVTAAETIYIGDNYYADVIGARNAGLHPILYDPKGIFADPDCEVISSFDQLSMVVERST